MIAKVLLKNPPEYKRVVFDNQNAVDGCVTFARKEIDKDDPDDFVWFIFLIIPIENISYIELEEE